jgi:hypothetical protein
MDNVAQPIERISAWRSHLSSWSNHRESRKNQGRIDEQRRLSADVPDILSPGPVMIWIVPTEEDEAGDSWTAGIAEEWADELSDVRQDIYTLADGEPIRES